MTKKSMALGIKIGLFCLVLCSMSVAFFYLTNNVSATYQKFINQLATEAEQQVGKVAFLDKKTDGKLAIGYFPIDDNGKPVDKLAQPLHQCLEMENGSSDITTFSYTKAKVLDGYHVYKLHRNEYQLESGKYELKNSELYATYYAKDSGEYISFQDLLEDTLDSTKVIEVLKTLIVQTVQSPQLKENVLATLDKQKLTHLDYVYTDKHFAILTKNERGKLTPVALDIATIIPYFKEKVVFETYQSVYHEKVAGVRAERQAARQQILQQIVHNIKQKVPTKKIALTFDDGPDDVTTPQVLDILEKYQVKGTFYMLGSRVAGNEAIIKRVVAQGHELGNHSWSHPDLTTVGPEEVQKQVEQTQEAITHASGGVAPKSMRPPYGAINVTVNRYIHLPIAMWNIDSLDWQSRSAEKVFEVVSTHIRDGSVILMHDIHQSTVDSLDRLIGTLKEQGYEMVTFSELYDANEFVGGIQYFSADDAQIVSE